MEETKEFDYTGKIPKKFEGTMSGTMLNFNKLLAANKGVNIESFQPSMSIRDKLRFKNAGKGGNKGAQLVVEMQQKMLSQMSEDETLFFCEMLCVCYKYNGQEHKYAEAIRSSKANMDAFFTKYKIPTYQWNTIPRALEPSNTFKEWLLAGRSVVPCVRNPCSALLLQNLVAKNVMLFIQLRQFFCFSLTAINVSTYKLPQSTAALEKVKERQLLTLGDEDITSLLGFAPFISHYIPFSAAADTGYVKRLEETDRVNMILALAKLDVDFFKGMGIQRSSWTLGAVRESIVNYRQSLYAKKQKIFGTKGAKMFKAPSNDTDIEDKYIVNFGDVQLANFDATSLISKFTKDS